MKQFVLPRPPGEDGRIRLSGKDYHYLVRVRRLGPGDSFNARSGGEALSVRILSLGGAGPDAFLEGAALPALSAAPYPAPQVQPPGMPPLLLFQALPKGVKMDLLVRQAAEGGISEIWPFISGHTVKRPAAPRIPAGDPAADAEADDPAAPGSPRTERWRRIIKEARQQSGSPIPTILREPCSIEALLARWGELKNRGALGLLFHQEPLEQGTFHGYLSTNPPLVALAVGPEGGFSSQEVRLFLGAGFRPLTMGNTVLRTETAALYAAAAARIMLLERESWIQRP